jgi:23S rRNA (cytosine1962-C5)-methyltransferase
VDFSRSALEIADRNADRNGFTPTSICQEIYPVLWQLAGRKVKRRPSPGRPLEKIEPRSFERIILDPPQRSKGYYGAVDIKKDYAGLFRPCLQIVADGGEIIATNNLAGVSLQEFSDELERCARKVGRPWKEFRVLSPDEDFPSPDGRPPLKIAVLSF